MINFNETNDVERELSEALVSGSVYGPEYATKDCKQIVDATLIRDLLRGVHAEIQPDPAGLQLRNICITGRLNLDRVRTDIALSLNNCTILEGISARFSQISTLVLQRTEITRVSETEPPIDLEGATAQLIDLVNVKLTNEMGPALLADKITISSGMFLRGNSLITAGGDKGAVRLTGANITGSLVLNAVCLINSRGPALSAGSITVGGGLFFDKDFIAEGAGNSGAVRLAGARIAGQIAMNGACLANSTGPALSADGLTVEGGMLLSEGFKARGAGDRGTIRLIGASIAGQFTMNGAHVDNSTGPALSAERLTVEGDMFLSESFEGRGAGNLGAIRLPGANVAGQFAMNGARLTNKKGPALLADGLTVGGNALFNSAFIVESGCDLGAIRLPGANVAGQFAMNGARLTNKKGPALLADRLTVGGSMFLNDGFEAKGAGNLGAIRLPGANVAGQFAMNGARLTNFTGPALSADGLTVGGGMLFNGGFQARGTGNSGAVRLAGASIAGQFSMSGARIANLTGPAFSADRLEVKGNMFLHEYFEARGVGDGGVVRLNGAYISGQLVISNVRLINMGGPDLSLNGTTIGGTFLLEFLPLGVDLECRPRIPRVKLVNTSVQGRFKTSEQTLSVSKNRTGTWDISGFTFRSLDGITPQRWLAFLAHGTESYSPEPYQQIAAVARREGHEDLVRQALIAQHEDLLNRSKAEAGLLTQPEKNKKRLLKWVVGYGYRPWLALAWLLVVMFLALSFMYLMWSQEYLKIINPETGDLLGACHHVDLWMLASDIIPLLKGSKTHCVADSWQEVFFVVVLLFKLMAWSLLTLFIAGFTNIIRRPTA